MAHLLNFCVLSENCSELMTSRFCVLLLIDRVFDLIKDFSLSRVESNFQVLYQNVYLIMDPFFNVG